MSNGRRVTGSRCRWKLFGHVRDGCPPSRITPGKRTFARRHRMSQKSPRREIFTAANLHRGAACFAQLAALPGRRYRKSTGPLPGSSPSNARLSVGLHPRLQGDRDRQSGAEQETGIWKVHHHFHDLGVGIELVAAAGYLSDLRELFPIRKSYENLDAARRFLRVKDLAFKFQKLQVLRVDLIGYAGSDLDWIELRDHGHLVCLLHICTFHDQRAAHDAGKWGITLHFFDFQEVAADLDTRFRDCGRRNVSLRFRLRKLPLRYDILFSKLGVVLQHQLGNPKLRLRAEQASLIALELELLLGRIKSKQRHTLLHILTCHEVYGCNLPVKWSRNSIGVRGRNHTFKALNARGCAAILRSGWMRAPKQCNA